MLPAEPLETVHHGNVLPRYQFPARVRVLIAVFGAVLLEDGAGHQLPVLRFGKELSGAVYERAAGIIVARS